MAPGCCNSSAFRRPRVLGPDADEEEIKALIERHGSVFIKPVFKGGVGKKGKASCWAVPGDLISCIVERVRNRG
jgi:hypothetical protein